MKTSLGLLKYLVLPARLLPKPQRGGVAFSVLTLGVGLDKSESLAEAWRYGVNWLKSLPAAFAFGQVMAELGTLQLYEREWKNVEGQAPVDGMLRWARKAVNTGPSAKGFAMGVWIHEGIQVWKADRFQRSETEIALEALRSFLQQTKFNQENVWLTVFPLATFSGAPLRPLPPD